MSARRAPSAPPEIPGYDYRSALGSGGFADVFLYQQALPARSVAIKVLLPEVVEGNLIEDFRQEANVMAELSTHPSIVTVYGAAVTADGRPYLAMEYCPRPNLGVRYRRERISVPEVLQLGVHIAGAVETAHRAGVLHRDIKPANILVTAYNRPALTDFGIATTAGAVDDGTAMSVPWSPPEAFASPPTSSRASDVFSLGATLYTLLASRTPFELPGMSNTSIDLITRIREGHLAPLARSDVPASLVSALTMAMDPDPSKRQPSALALGRALQRVEAELALPVTQMDVLDETLPENIVVDDDGGATRIRGIVSIAQEPEDHTVVRGREPVTQASEAFRAPAAENSAPREVRRGWIGITAAALAVAALVVVVVIALLFPPEGLQADPDETLPPQVQQTPQQPIELNATATGGVVTFTWTNPAPQDGDTYQVRIDATGQDPSPTVVETESVEVQGDPDGTTCIAVAVVRETGRSSNFAEECFSG